MYLFLDLIKVESYLGEKSAYVFEGRGDDLSVSHQAPALPTRISEPFREWSEKGNIRIYTVHISGGEGRVIFTLAQYVYADLVISGDVRLCKDPQYESDLVLNDIPAGWDVDKKGPAVD